MKALLQQCLAALQNNLSCGHATEVNEDYDETRAAIRAIQLELATQHAMKPIAHQQPETPQRLQRTIGTGRMFVDPVGFKAVDTSHMPKFAVSGELVTKTPDECRIELVTAIHLLASDFENMIGSFGNDYEARKLAIGSIAHARGVAVKWNRNGAMFAPKATDANNESSMFAVGIAARKWRDLQANGYRMRHIQFVNDAGTVGEIDIWGRVLWKVPPIPEVTTEGTIEGTTDNEPKTYTEQELETLPVTDAEFAAYMKPHDGMAKNNSPSEVPLGNLRTTKELTDPIGRGWGVVFAYQRMVDDAAAIVSEQSILKDTLDGIQPKETMMADLTPELAIATARKALSYSDSFNNIDWQNGEPWPHRMELAQALDWITELGAMVLNLADKTVKGTVEGTVEGTVDSTIVNTQPLYPEVAEAFGYLRDIDSMLGGTSGSSICLEASLTNLNYQMHALNLKALTTASAVDNTTEYLLDVLVRSLKLATTFVPAGHGVTRRAWKNLIVQAEARHTNDKAINKTIDNSKLYATIAGLVSALKLAVTFVPSDKGVIRREFESLVTDAEHLINPKGTI